MFGCDGPGRRFHFALKPPHEICRAEAVRPEDLRGITTRSIRRCRELKASPMPPWPISPPSNISSLPNTKFIDAVFATGFDNLVPRGQATFKHKMGGIVRRVPAPCQHHRGEPRARADLAVIGAL